MGLGAIELVRTRRISTRTATERTDRSRDPRKTFVSTRHDLRISLYFPWFSSSHRVESRRHSPTARYRWGN
jgi:hypothetical protein